MEVTGPAGASTETKVGAGCLTLFALPFALIGIGAALWLAWELGRGEADLERAVFLGAFAVSFGAAGFGMFAATQFGFGRVAEEEALEHLHPDEPWRWRADWAQGYARADEPAQVVFRWIFALVWCGISAPLLLRVPSEVEKGNLEALVGYLFPAVGLGLLAWAVRATLRWRRFGESRLELQTLPGALGRTFRAVLHARFRVPADGEVRVRLSSVSRVVEGSGRRRRTHGKVLWQHETIVPAGAVQAGPAGAAVPIAFRLPAEGRPTDESDPDDRLVWRLEVSAALPGIDYHASFEVPVFDVGGPEPVDEPPPPAPLAPPRRRQAVLGLSPEGGLEVRFPPLRNPVPAVSVTAFTVVWWGFTALLVRLGVELLFLSVFALFGAVMVLVSLWMTFGAARVRVDAGRLRVRHSFLGLGKTTEIPAEAVAKIGVDVGLQSSGTAFFDLVVERRTGSPVRVGSALRDRREAEWLAGEIHTRLA